MTSSNSSPPKPITSATILASQTAFRIVTGVRGLGGRDVVLTGTAVIGGVQNPMLYVGPLWPAASGTVYTLTPQFPGQSVSGATFYGPDTPAFNPAIAKGNVRAVGSYTYSGSSVRNHGLLYEGPPAGGGSWTQLDVPPGAVGGQTVENTLAHSTMGDLVVGNYDLAGVPASANAFVYDLAAKSWTIFDFGGSAALTTAYGIWQTAIGGTKYVIVGGTRHADGLNKGYVVNYDSASGAFSDLTYYSALNVPSLVTHFEGITATATGYNLAALTLRDAAMFASLSLNADGSFGEASWVPFAYSRSLVTTGNTVYENTMLGIYAVSGTPGAQSYAAAFG